MNKKIVYWGIGIALFGAVLFALGRISSSLPRSAQEGPPSFSLSPGGLGMVSGGAGYSYELSTGILPTQQVVDEVRGYIDSLGNPDFALFRLREFTWAYQAEVIEKSTGLHAFDLMVSKSNAQVSPKAGPNLFWNTKYGFMIAAVGGGYGMLGRMVDLQSSSEIAVDKNEAQSIVEKALVEIGADLKLDEDTAAFYGFNVFYVQRAGQLVGELDVNGFSGQVWYVNWGEP